MARVHGDVPQVRPTSCPSRSLRVARASCTSNRGRIRHTGYLPVTMSRFAVLSLPSACRPATSSEGGHVSQHAERQAARLRAEHCLPIMTWHGGGNGDVLLEAPRDVRQMPFRPMANHTGRHTRAPPRPMGQERGISPTVRCCCGTESKDNPHLASRRFRWQRVVRRQQLLWPVSSCAAGRQVTCKVPNVDHRTRTMSWPFAYDPVWRSKIHPSSILAAVECFYASCRLVGPFPGGVQTSQLLEAGMIMFPCPGKYPK